MTSTKDTLKAIQESLKRGQTPAQLPLKKDFVAKSDGLKVMDKSHTAVIQGVEIVEKTEGKKRTVKDNGGARSGSGRKPLAQDEKRKTIKRQWEDFASEEIEVNELHKGTREIRKLKMARLRVAQEKLFKKVQEGDVSAIREFNDRVGGKAPQTLRGGDEDDTPIQIELGVDRMLDKVYGNKDDDDE